MDNSNTTGKVCRALVRWIQVEVQFLVLPFEISSLGNQSVSILADVADNWRADLKLIERANYGTLITLTGLLALKKPGRILNPPSQICGLFLLQLMTCSERAAPWQRPIDAGAQGSSSDNERLGLQPPTFITSRHPIAPSIFLVPPNTFAWPSQPHSSKVHIRRGGLDQKAPWRQSPFLRGVVICKLLFCTP